MGSPPDGGDSTRATSRPLRAGTPVHALILTVRRLHVKRW
jgi:hypothetical protein